MTVPRVKICCIASVEEARLAIRNGVSAIGLVSAMPSGPGVIDESRIAEIVSIIPPGVASFLLTSKQDADSIIHQQHLTKVNAIQLVDAVPVRELQTLREKLPGISLVQVIHVSGESSIEEAAAVEQYVDAILLDSGNPKLAVKELGGTGRKHDWTISKHIVEAVKKQVFLAGGLTPSNVRQAIETVHPYGVDVCSGVRLYGHLDEEKVKQFMKNVQQSHSHV